MTGPEHLREGERLLRKSKLSPSHEDGPQGSAQALEWAVQALAHFVGAVAWVKVR